MNDRKLAKELLIRCVDDNIDSYRQLLEKLPREEAKDPYWIKLLDFYDRSNNEDKEFILGIMRQVSIDSVASVLSIIDGSGYSETNEELTLLDSSGNQLQGCILDSFLEQCE